MVVHQVELLEFHVVQQQLLLVVELGNLALQIVYLPLELVVVFLQLAIVVQAAMVVAFEQTKEDLHNGEGVPPWSTPVEQRESQVQSNCSICTS